MYGAGKVKLAQYILFYLWEVPMILVYKHLFHVLVIKLFLSIYVFANIHW
jgi:hypothetical protein